MMKFRSLTYF
ncbi:unnamed protein product, partial [Didymodactylos carnosus]